jgi:hypothetical protein
MEGIEKEKIQEAIDALESRQLELGAVMSRSDAHASKCAKLGLKFGDEYPDELDAYLRANAEYNENEKELARLYAERGGAE